MDLVKNQPDHSSFLLETMRIVVAFDVSSDKTRRRLTKLLKGYLYRHHESVFQGDINPAKLYKLRKKIEKCIKHDRDKVRIVPLCTSDEKLIRTIGEGIEKPIAPQEVVLI